MSSSSSYGYSSDSSETSFSSSTSLSSSSISSISLISSISSISSSSSYIENWSTSSTSYIENWSSSSSSSSSYILSPWNRLVAYRFNSFGATGGNSGSILVGERELFDLKISDISGICTDRSGNIFVSDPVKNVILKVYPSGEFYIYAGKLGVSGNNDNNRVKGSDALFNQPNGLTCDSSGNLYVADTGNNQIRKITTDQYVTLVAGSPTGVSGFVSGIGSIAKFNSPQDVSADRSCNVFVADTGNHAIRVIKLGISQVNTVAGNGIAGDGYGPGNSAKLNGPFSITCDNAGIVYIMDSGNFKIKLLDKGFNVLRFSGTGIQGDTVGNAGVCQYNIMKYSDCDPSGNIYIIDYRVNGGRLLRVNTNGTSAILRDFLSTTEGYYIVGVAVNNSGQLYLTESVV